MSLNKINESGWPELLKSYDGNLLLETARFIQYSKPEESSKALVLYDTILADKLAGEDLDYEVYSLRSLLYQERAESDKSKDSIVQASSDIVMLLLNDISSALQTASVKLNISRLLSVVSLYEQAGYDDNKVIINILDPLIAKLEAFGSGNVLLAVGNEAESLFYIYAIYLEKDENYSSAIKYFDAIESDKYSRQARFQAVLCRYRIVSANGSHSGNHQVLIDQLKKIITYTDGLDQIDIQAAELLLAIALESGQDNVFMDSISLILEKVQSDTAGPFVGLACSFISRQTGKMQNCAVMGRVGDNSDYFGSLISIAEKCAGSDGGADNSVALDALLSVYSFKYSGSIGQLAENVSGIELLGYYKNNRELFEQKSIISVRLKAMALAFEGQYLESRKIWQQVRNTTKADGGYYYWEARFWGILLLIC